MPTSPQWLHRIKSHSDLSEPAAAVPAAGLPTQAGRPRFQDWGAPSSGGGSFDQGLGSSFMTVLGCLGHLRSPVVYFYRVVDLDIWVRTGKTSAEFRVSLSL